MQLHRGPCTVTDCLHFFFHFTAIMNPLRQAGENLAAEEMPVKKKFLKCNSIFVSALFEDRLSDHRRPMTADERGINAENQCCASNQH